MAAVLVGLAIGFLFFAVQAVAVLIVLKVSCEHIEDAGGDVEAYLREVERGMAMQQAEWM